MPFFSRGYRWGLVSIALPALLVGCGGESNSGNSSDVEMTGLQKADGTINDAMTDLDGVQVEGTAMASAGNEGAVGNSAVPPMASADNSSGTADSGDEEVVAAQ